MVWSRFRARLERKCEQRRKDIAHKLWLRREKQGKPGDWDKDSDAADKIVANPLRMLGFDLNGPLIWAEKTWFEPMDRLLDRAAFFGVIDRLSPTLEATGVLLIPLVLYFATQSFENRRDEREVQRLLGEEAA